MKLTIENDSGKYVAEGFEFWWIAGMFFIGIMDVGATVVQLFK